VKTTIDIPDEALGEVMRHTGARTKREAVLAAIEEFNRRRRVGALVSKFGTLDGFMTGEELLRLREEE
jgi:Bacterial antitoxin of type II TA system, VapB